MIGLLLSISAVALGPLPGETFNLECAGTVTTRAVDVDTTEHYAAVYRIDLGRNKWCESTCEALHDIHSVQPTQITLESKSVDTPSQKSEGSNYVDRVTGAQQIFELSSIPGHPRLTVIMKWIGQCTKAAFSGFPSFDTKF